MNLRKPDFFIVGAAKSGTTSLYEYMKQHPKVFLPEQKEPHFFGEMKPPGTHHINNENDYYDLFRGAPVNAVVGEASTSYLYSPDAASRIKKFKPDSKIIIILRNPVDRAYSMYRHQVRDGFETLSFEEGLVEEDKRIKEEWHYGYHYYSGGVYAWQVEEYYSLFGKENVKVYIFEEFKKTPNVILKDIFNFLNIENTVEIETTQVHNISNKPKNLKLNTFLKQKNPIKELLKKVMPFNLRNKIKRFLVNRNMKTGYDKMSVETRKSLINKYQPEIEKLEKTLNRDLSIWKM